MRNCQAEGHFAKERDRTPPLARWSVPRRGVLVRSRTSRGRAAPARSAAN